MTAEAIQGWLQVGVGGLLLIALFLGARGTWVFGATHRAQMADKDLQLAEAKAERDRQLVEVKADRDEWKTIALASLNTTEKVAVVAATAAKNGK